MMIQLVLKCIQDVSSSMAFFFLWIFLFALVFQTLGLEIYYDDYGGLGILPTYMMFTYRNTLGDITAPGYNYWLNQSETDPLLSNFMIITIWAFWIINQWLVLIIILNILIAIISNAYDTTVSNHTNDKYRYRAEINRYMRYIERLLGIDTPIDCIIISNSINEKDENTLSGMVQEITECVLKSNDELKS